MFSIELVGVQGRIVAESLDEEFEVDTSEWGENDYRSSWLRELQRMVDGVDRAVLLTVAMAPQNANWLRGYVLYRFGEEVRVQERIFFVEQLPRDFDLSNPGSSLEDFESVDEDGFRISEWKFRLWMFKFCDQLSKE